MLLHFQLIRAIDKCEIGPADWNDKDYENKRIHYNNLIRKLVKSLMEVVDQCKAFTYCLNNIMGILGSVEKNINKGTFENNLELLKQQVIKLKYKTEASVHELTRTHMGSLTFRFFEVLRNVQGHISDIFVDYREALYMVHLMMDETLKMTDAQDNSHDDSQLTEVQEKLRVLAIQQSKMQKEKEELEELKHELKALSNSLNDEKKHLRDAHALENQLIRRKKLYNGKVQALLEERRSMRRDQKMDSADLLEKYKQKSLEYEKLQQQLHESVSTY